MTKHLKFRTTIFNPVIFFISFFLFFLTQSINVKGDTLDYDTFDYYHESFNNFSNIKLVDSFGNPLRFNRNYLIYEINDTSRNRGITYYGWANWDYARLSTPRGRGTPITLLPASGDTSTVGRISPSDVVIFRSTESQFYGFNYWARANAPNSGIFLGNRNRADTFVISSNREGGHTIRTGPNNVHINSNYWLIASYNSQPSRFIFVPVMTPNANLTNIDEAIQDFISDSKPNLIKPQHTIDYTNFGGRTIRASYIKSKDVIYLGPDILRNNTGITQTLNSTGFQRAIESTTSTTTTHGFTASYTATATIRVPFVTGQVTTFLEYQFDTNNTNSTTVTNTFTAPPQSIIVPPHKVFRVDSFLELIYVEGETEIYADVFGSVTSLVNNRRVRFNNLGWFLRHLQPGQEYNGFSPVTNNSLPRDIQQGMRLTGRGTFSTQYGFRSFITVTDITDPTNTFLVDEFDLFTTKITK